MSVGLYAQTSPWPLPRGGSRLGCRRMQVRIRRGSRDAVTVQVGTSRATSRSAGLAGALVKQGDLFDAIGRPRSGSGGRGRWRRRSELGVDRARRETSRGSTCVRPGSAAVRESCSRCKAHACVSRLESGASMGFNPRLLPVVSPPRPCRLSLDHASPQLAQPFSSSKRWNVPASHLDCLWCISGWVDPCGVSVLPLGEWSRRLSSCAPLLMPAAPCFPLDRIDPVGQLSRLGEA